LRHIELGALVIYSDVCFLHEGPSKSVLRTVRRSSKGEVVRPISQSLVRRLCCHIKGSVVCRIPDQAEFLFESLAGIEREPDLAYSGINRSIDRLYRNNGVLYRTRLHQNVTLCFELRHHTDTMRSIRPKSDTAKAPTVAPSTVYAFPTRFRFYLSSGVDTIIIVRADILRGNSNTQVEGGPCAIQTIPKAISKSAANFTMRLAYQTSLGLMLNGMPLRPKVDIPDYMRTLAHASSVSTSSRLTNFLLREIRQRLCRKSSQTAWSLAPIAWRSAGCAKITSIHAESMSLVILGVPHLKDLGSALIIETQKHTLQALMHLFSPNHNSPRSIAPDAAGQTYFPVHSTTLFGLDTYIPYVSSMLRTQDPIRRQLSRDLHRYIFMRDYFEQG
ncbi:hypothetical protein KCU65_g20, partial [Aureobasidium melanogenum]